MFYLLSRRAHMAWGGGKALQGDLRSVCFLRFLGPRSQWTAGLGCLPPLELDQQRTWPCRGSIAAVSGYGMAAVHSGGHRLQASTSHPQRNKGPCKISGWSLQPPATGSTTRAGEKGQRYKVQQEAGVSFRPGVSRVWAWHYPLRAVQRDVQRFSQGKTCWRL